MNSHLAGTGPHGSPRTPAGTVRWGFLGAGGIARNSVGPAVHAVAGSALYAVASGDGDRSRALDPEVTHARYEQLLRDPAVDVVYLSLHNSAHRRWCAEALRAGKHVLCEKPLGMTAAEVAELTELARSADRLLVEAMWSRWHPRMRALPDLVASTGVRRVEAEFEGPRPEPGNYRHNPALGGGALLDLGCYAVAAVLEVFGWEPPVVLDAKVHCGPDGADESATAELGFTGGTASVRVSLTGGQAQRLHVDADAVELSLSAPVFTALDTESETVVQECDGAVEDIRYPACNPYRLMVASVAAAVRGEQAWLVPLAQSHAVAATLDSIRAAAEGKVRR